MSENLLTGKRFIDLSNQAYKRDIVTFSDFLTLSELNILHQNSGKYSVHYEVFGGYAYAERQIAAFVPDALSYAWDYPVICLKLSPAYPKFAEELSHRDILGAVMSLGIERAKIGDISVAEDGAYLFCKKEIADYLLTEITQIRHTIVHLAPVDAGSLDIQPKMQEYEAIISSNRIDNVVAVMIHKSRSNAVDLIRSGKVAVMGSECLHNTYLCKENDVISIRGYGKFLFAGALGVTKKDRMKILYKKYI